MQVLNYSALLDLMGGSEEVAHQLLSTYLPDAERLCHAIQSSAKVTDFDALKKDSHSLKGSSRLIGAELFGDACYALEQAAAAHDEIGVTQALKNFDTEYHCLVEHIGKKLQA